MPFEIVVDELAIVLISVSKGVDALTAVAGIHPVSFILHTLCPRAIFHLSFSVKVVAFEIAGVYITIRVS